MSRRCTCCCAGNSCTVSGSSSTLLLLLLLLLLLSPLLLVIMAAGQAPGSKFEDTFRQVRVVLEKWERSYAMVRVWAA
jgi:hypothetical protein